MHAILKTKGEKIIETDGLFVTNSFFCAIMANWVMVVGAVFVMRLWLSGVITCVYWGNNLTAKLECYKSFRWRNDAIYGSIFGVV